VSTFKKQRSSSRIKHPVKRFGYLIIVKSKSEDSDKNALARGEIFEYFAKTLIMKSPGILL
jgi:hypothetical protein